MRLAHPDSPVVRDAGAIRSAAELTARWTDIALRDPAGDPDRWLLDGFEDMAELAGWAIARAYFLEHERPAASVTSLASRRNRKAAPTARPRLGA